MIGASARGRLGHAVGEAAVVVGPRRAVALEGGSGPTRGDVEVGVPGHGVVGVARRHLEQLAREARVPVRDVLEEGRRYLQAAHRLVYVRVVHVDDAETKRPGLIDFNLAAMQTPRAPSSYHGAGPAEKNVDPGTTRVNDDLHAHGDNANSASNRRSEGASAKAPARRRQREGASAKRGQRSAVGGKRGRHPRYSGVGGERRRHLIDAGAETAGEGARAAGDALVAGGRPEPAGDGLHHASDDVARVGLLLVGSRPTPLFPTPASAWTWRTPSDTSTTVAIFGGRRSGRGNSLDLPLDRC